MRVAGYGVTRIAPEQLDDEADSIAADLKALLGRPQGIEANVTESAHAKYKRS